MTPESLKTELGKILELANNEEATPPGTFIKNMERAIREIDTTAGQIRRIWVEFVTKMIFSSGIARDLLLRKRHLLTKLLTERSDVDSDDWMVLFGLYSAISTYFGVLPGQNQGSTSYVHDLFTQLFTTSEDYTPTHQELIPVVSKFDYLNFEKISNSIKELESSFDKESIKNELFQSIEENKEALKMLREEEKKRDDLFREYSSMSPSAARSRIMLKNESQFFVGDLIRYKIYVVSHNDTPCDAFVDELKIEFSFDTSWKIIRKSQGVYTIRARPRQEGPLALHVSVLGEAIQQSILVNVVPQDIAGQFRCTEVNPNNFNKIEPFGICATSDDKILVCANVDNKEGRLGVIQQTKFSLVEGRMTRPYNIAVDDKIWYVSDVDGPNKCGRIHIFVDGKYSREMTHIINKNGETKPRPFDQPRGLGVLKSKNIVVSEGGKAHQISIIDPTTGYCIRSFGRFGNKPGEFNWPASVAVDSKDRIVVADENNHRFQIFDEYGRLLGLFGKQGTSDGEFNGTTFGPFGVCVDSNDFIYTVDQFGHRVQIFTPEGIFVSKMGDNTHFSSPFCICFNSKGTREIYVTDRKKKIIRFDSESDKPFQRKRLTSKPSFFFSKAYEK